jgi:hypothetical protein
MQQSGQNPGIAYLRGNRFADRNLINPHRSISDKARHASNCFCYRGFIAPLDGAGHCRRRAIMFGVDAFIVNVAVPTIAVELHASLRSRP